MFFHSPFTSVELLFGLVVKLVMDCFESIETYLSALLGMVWHSLCSRLRLAPLLKVALLWSLPECVTLSSVRSWGSGVSAGALFLALRELWEWFVSQPLGNCSLEVVLVQPYGVLHHSYTDWISGHHVQISGALSLPCCLLSCTVP